MNKLRLCPEKDYTANRLKSGLLQLSADTSLVIDETRLQPGQLEAVGKTHNEHCFRVNDTHHIYGI